MCIYSCEHNSMGPFCDNKYFIFVSTLIYLLHHLMTTFIYYFGVLHSNNF